MRGRNTPVSRAETRSRVIDVLRRTPATTRELALGLGLSYGAVRLHLLSLERARLIRPAEVRRGGTRPSVVWEVAPEADAALSRVYPPFAAQVLRVLGERLPATELGETLRVTGRRLAAGLPRPAGNLRSRVHAAGAVLDQLGAPNEVVQLGARWAIRGFGCPLGLAVRERPEACLALEAMLEELLRAPVRECCDRGPRPRCRFEVTASS